MDPVTMGIVITKIKAFLNEVLSNQYVPCTTADNTPYGVSFTKDGVTVTGTLVASADTTRNIYLVPDTHESGDYFDEYITVLDGTNNYLWEKIGNTEIHLSDLGDLAFKDSASGSYTPEGTVSAPDVTVTPDTVAKFVAENATGGGNVTPGSAAQCTMPELTVTEENHEIRVSMTPGSFTANTPTAVTLPQFTEQTIATGIQSASASAPAFTGTPGTINVE